MFYCNKQNPIYYITIDLDKYYWRKKFKIGAKLFDSVYNAIVDICASEKNTKPLHILQH